MPEDMAHVVNLLTEIRDALRTPPAEGLDAAAAAALVGVSVSMWHRLNTDGLCPSPVRIGDGRCPRWLRSELTCWLKAGAPGRSKWNLMRDTVIRRAG